MSERLDAICCSFGDGDAGRLVGFRACDDGELQEVAGIATPAPTFLAISSDGEHCYVVHDQGGELRSFRIDEEALADDEETGTEDEETVAVDDPALHEVNCRPTGGEEPCYVSLDPTGEYAIVANYGGGSIALFPIRDDGALGERAQLLEHEGSGPNADRQSEPHPHSIVPGPDGRFFYAPDLGTDEIWCYELDRDAALLEPAAQSPSRFETVPAPDTSRSTRTARLATS